MRFVLHFACVTVLFNFVMYCIASNIVVAFEISIFYLLVLFWWKSILCCV